MYNPSEAGKKGSIFGLPYNLEESDLILVPVHLDVTVSYSDGTAKAPNRILEESTQLDLSLLDIHNPWELKMAMYGKTIKSGQNDIHRGRARNVIDALEAGKKVDHEQLIYVNEFCQKVHEEIEQLCSSLLDLDKLVAVIGGDHSSPLGLIRSLGKRKSFGILQIDAHMDLRSAYEDFEYSHASIMYNALKVDNVISLTQVGIRDFCEEEEQFIEDATKDIHVFYDEVIQKEKDKGNSWSNQCDQIVNSLPENVYISFDVDGLDPSLCPNTGTPVPGGLTFNEAVLLFEKVVKANKKIVGFDVCETGNNTWDANVASRILYRLASYTGVSNKLLRLR